MSDKDKPKAPQPKNIPKDGQVITAIMKEMGITEYEPKTVVQLTEFVYKYGTSILEEARTFANNSKKKIDLDDVRLALLLSSENIFTMPPSREVLLECARNKNHSPLPLMKPHCGLRLPPDRHCLSSSNFILKNNQKKHKINYSVANASPPMKIAAKQNINYIKRTNAVGVTKQSVTVPKPITKISSNPGTVHPQKTVLKPKIQITSQSVVPSAASDGPMDVDASNGIKRKREDDSGDA